MKSLIKKSSNQKTPKPKLLVMFLLLFSLVLGIALFIFNNGPGTIKRIYYGSVTRSAYHKEYKNLQPALEGLGLNENKNAKSSCEIEEIATDGINASKVLFCGLQTDNYVEITGMNKQKLLDAAKQLDELTSKNGGKLQTNIDTTFNKYITDITNGVDYNPDFGATFVRDDYLCSIHFNVAYSNPKPPAYSIQFGCNSPRVTQDDFYLSPPTAGS
jgi:hypothetical protein